MKNSVLIVEDDRAIRESVRYMLDLSGFEVHCACDGQEGLEKLENNEIDLIICDVMMPVMDGFEFVQNVRKNLSTEITPILMLTAAIDLQHKLKGLEYGADDYIHKPFEFKVLLLKINNHIRRHQRTIQKAYTEPQKINIVSEDEVLLKKLNVLIDNSLSNTRLRIEDIANSLNMSSSSLTRKIKQITNKTPNQYLKEFRLNRAKEMIQLKYGNLSEVAAKTGFSSLSYFSTCYKEHFGSNPKEDLPGSASF